MQPAANPIGHNNPPTDAETLQQSLREKHDPLLTGAQKLIEAAARIPDVIEDDETAGKAGDYIKLVTGSKKSLEAERVSEKEPYLSLGRVVDGFFKRVTDSLDASKAKAQRPLDTFLKKKAFEEQQRRLAEAERLRKESAEQQAAAEALEKARMQSASDSVMEQAVVTEQAAAKVQASAEVRPAQLASSRGESGARASLRTRWVGEIAEFGETIDLEKLRPFLNPEAVQKALNLFVQAGGRELRGAKIYEKSEAVVR